MQKNILVIGGTGLVGKTILRILADRNPQHQLYIGSRKSGSTKTQLQIDVNDPKTFVNIAGHAIDIIVLSVSDSHNNVLRYALDHGIDYVDVTKPTPAMIEAYRLVRGHKPESRLVFGSGWMGGIVSGLIAAAVPEKKNIQGVGLFVYYSIKDQAGESSAHFMAENVYKPFVRYENNRPVTIRHFLDSEYHNFSFGIGKRQAYNFDVPDLFVLNTIEGIPDVSVKMTYNSKFITRLLGIFQYLRIFNMLSLKERRMIFGSGGSGDQTLFDIVIKVQDRTKTISVRSAKGQAELTALSMVLHVEKLIHGAFPNGIYFAHQLHKPQELMAQLQGHDGITVKCENGTM
ncbi:saccharopine dehydrogenase NADP-binding domain-containing protein [Flavobacterium kingsejongi]|uniref:Saccharopine dehydrogenase n=1 Tax=Flavobacterium kingsejongi TaxID=1678728 RepID=A0A2S1LQV9_9FLAO|nr:saccharopine dehydrogenase [Flavobacterium kingsejongi]AWG26147.1 saccharopine dehydrogenase [Flavobacterium kingsejongi]